MLREVVRPANALAGLDPNLYYCANNLNQYTTTDDTTTCPPSTPTESFAYDNDGNLTGDGGKAPGASRPDGTPRKFTWDAENRLIRVEPADGCSPVSGDVKVEFRYDYMGRRVEKKVSTHDGSSWGVTDTRRFLWYNWLMLLELDGDNDILKKYTWGLDLAGLSGQVNSLESAGGIGGLLACYDTAGTSGTGDDKSYAYMFDGNGNVGQLVDVSDGSIDAHYEYDAYGNAVVAIGSYAASNAIRFSSKYWDDETALGYWGYRFHNSHRWLQRDPIGESDGPNLYSFVQNRPTFRVDSIGRCTWCPDECEPYATECVYGIKVTRIAPDALEVTEDLLRSLEWYNSIKLIGDLVAARVNTSVYFKRLEVCNTYIMDQADNVHHDSSTHSILGPLRNYINLVNDEFVTVWITIKRRDCRRVTCYPWFWYGHWKWSRFKAVTQWRGSEWQPLFTYYEERTRTQEPVREIRAEEWGKSLERIEDAIHALLKQHGCQ